jgi:type II secretory pathway component PulK
MMGDARKTMMRSPMPRNDRGVALLIVLLVTALLIALIFEFSYATRISLNSAINFRDSQRAYFLARSGIYAFINYGDKLRDTYIPQGEWGVVPIISDGDTQVMIKWENEQGKIPISIVTRNNDAYGMLSQLFSLKQIDQSVLDNQIAVKNNFYLASELHAILNKDEDYLKVAPYVTVSPVPARQININTASAEVLQSLCRSLGKDDGVVGMIISQRSSKPYAKKEEIPLTPGMDSLVATYLDVASSYFTVYSYATVGGYTRQIEAIVKGKEIFYWRAL